MSRKFYCHLCKTKITGIKGFKKHALTHFTNDRCPYCDMKTKNLRIHLAFYHIKFKKSMLLNRDLAILAKEANSLMVLDDPELKLDRFKKYNIIRLMKKL